MPNIRASFGLLQRGSFVRYPLLLFCKDGSSAHSNIFHKMLLLAGTFAVEKVHECSRSRYVSV
jgi:hypothetical protein